MAKLTLSKNVTLEIDDGTQLHIFNVTYKELTGKQVKELTKMTKDAIKLSSEAEVLDGKIRALESKEDGDSVADKIVSLYEKKQKLEDRFEKMGGVSILNDTLAQKFKLSIGGADKNNLISFIEDHSDYETILSAIIKDAEGN